MTTIIAKPATVAGFVVLNGILIKNNYLHLPLVSATSQTLTSAMEQFKMKPPTKAQMLGRLSLQLFPVILSVTAGLLYIRVFHLSSLTVYRIALGICVALLIAFYFIGWQKFKRMYYSYTLTISGNVIMREQANAPTVKLSFIEVNEIAKHPNGSYTIKGKSHDECIEIPNQIDNIHTLERALNEIRPMVLKAS